MKNNFYQFPWPDAGQGSSCHSLTCANGGQCVIPRVLPHVAMCDCDLTTFTGPTCEDGE